MDMPSVESVTAILNGGTPAEEPKVVAQATPEATPSETPADPAAKPDETPQPQQPAPDVTTTIAARIKESGARQFFESLPDDVKEQLGAELYPGLHRVLSKRTNEAATLRAEMQATSAALQTNIERALASQMDELMTAGLNEEDKKAYVERKELERLRKDQEAKAKGPQQPEVDPAQYAEAQRKMEYAWSLVDRAGLPRDPNHPEVRALDFAWDEPDFGKAMQRLSRSISSKTSGKAAAAAAPNGASNDEAVKKLAAEMAQRIVQDELKKAGILKADTGRPGSATGGGPPTSMRSAREATIRLLQEAGGR